MPAYEFITIWNLSAPIDAVWNEVKASEKWPEWWKGVIEMKALTHGNEDGIGGIYRSTWRSALPYNLEFDLEITRVEHLKLLEARAFGELEGTGLWRFTSEGENQTRVQYDWSVQTTKRWMNVFAPVAKPFFKWNHDIIMRWGEQGLRKRLSQASVETANHAA